VDRTVYVSGIGPNIGTFGYAVNKGQEVFNNSEGEYNPVISDGKRIYLTGTSTIRAFKPETKAEKKRKRARAQNQKSHGLKHHGGKGKQGASKKHKGGGKKKNGSK
jgi:hypothetical protein